MYYFFQHTLIVIITIDVWNSSASSWYSYGVYGVPWCKFNENAICNYVFKTTKGCNIMQSLIKQLNFVNELF